MYNNTTWLQLIVFHVLSLNSWALLKNPMVIAKTMLCNHIIFKCEWMFIRNVSILYIYMGSMEDEKMCRMCIILRNCTYP